MNIQNGEPVALINDGDLLFVATTRRFFKTNDPVQGWQQAANSFTLDYFHDSLL